MANDETKRYINNIYINGTPYACRDEELTKSVADLTLKTERIGHILSNHDDWLNNCYDNSNNCLKGNVDWNRLETSPIEKKGKDNLAPFPVFSAAQISNSRDYIVRISTKAKFESGWKDPKTEGNTISDGSGNTFTPIHNE